MTTIAIQQKRSGRFFSNTTRTEAQPTSTLAIASIGCIAVFIAFVLLYQTPVISALPSLLKMMFTALGVIVAPALALGFSITSLRRYVKDHTKVRGMFMAYVSFFVSTLYFMTALALPIVLLGMYVVYVYIW